MLHSGQWKCLYVKGQTTHDAGLQADISCTWMLMAFSAWEQTN